jgi:dolichol-phosphate mannosyltransferase
MRLTHRNLHAIEHPPEKVPELIRALESSAFVIGTRYAGGDAIDKDWPLYRRVISSGARLLARPLTPLSDPMV